MVYKPETWFLLRRGWADETLFSGLTKQEYFRNWNLLIWGYVENDFTYTEGTKFYFN
jgi:hypothetical protein